MPMQCTFKLAGRPVSFLRYSLASGTRAAAAPTTPIHSCTPDFCVKFPHAFGFGPVEHTHIVSQTEILNVIGFKLISVFKMVDEYF